MRFENWSWLNHSYVDKDALKLFLSFLFYCLPVRGLTLADGIEEIYKNTATMLKKTISVTLSGVDGAEQIKESWLSSVTMLKEWNIYCHQEDFKAQTAYCCWRYCYKLGKTPPSDVLEIHTCWRFHGLQFAFRYRTKNQIPIAVVVQMYGLTKLRLPTPEAEINAFVK